VRSVDDLPDRCCLLRRWRARGHLLQPGGPRVRGGVRPAAGAWTGQPEAGGRPQWGGGGKGPLGPGRGLGGRLPRIGDRNAVSKANANAGLEPLASPWLNTINVVRRAWPDRYEKGSCGLKVLADHFGIEFQHHDALEDAIATGRILAKAIRDTGLGPHDWIARCNQPIRPKVRIRKPAMNR